MIKTTQPSCNTAFSFLTFTVQVARQFFKLLLPIILGAITAASHAITLTPVPPFLTEVKGAPMIMINMSRDHQLFAKAYNEYSDLNGDGIVETQYLHSYEYYGYFDNQRCYTYNTADNRYVPSRKVDTTGYCNYTGGSSEWAGNFMNWATMTRLDVVRRILYGGFRSTDDSIVSGVSLTVLERANLTHDAHAFAKYYIAADISKLTPFNKPEITICNSSLSATGRPKIYVADGNYSLWGANERWQCHWSEDKAASNGNDPVKSGLNAASSNPSKVSNGLGVGDDNGTYIARIEVCKTGLTGGFTSDENGRCKLYPSGNYKPVGLLQKFGEKNEAAFGLMTGSYDNNVSGGLLRKNVASFTDEVDIDDGQFKNFDGIVSTLNKLKLYGYNYGDGTYLSDGAGCSYQQIGLVNGQCASWGNPIGEIYQESLRYFSGATENSTFRAVTTTKDNALGLTIAAWANPFAKSTEATFGEPLCRRSSIINFNASVTSFDNDDWNGITSVPNLSTATVNDYTNKIGAAEGLYAAGKLWSIGRNGIDDNGFCSDKTLSATGLNTLSNANGICPEAPTQRGGYKMAGAALFAHTNPIRNDFTIPANNKKAFKIDTYSVALATGSPRIKIPVPGKPGKFVFLSPSYRLDLGAGGGGTLVDFKVISQTATSGKYVLNWEDSEQGGDFDQDLFGTLEYNVVGTQLFVKTFVVFDSTGGPQGFGYSITGSGATDGVHFHSGIHGFTYNDPRTVTVTITPSAPTAAPNTNATGGCNGCEAGQTATTAAYNMVGVSGDSLKDPLWYAAKYGGFDTSVTATYTIGAILPVDAWDKKNTDGSTGADGIPDNYFLAVDPAELERSLSQVFSGILKAGGAAPAAASARTEAGGYAYVSTQSIKAAAGAQDADASSTFARYAFQLDGSLSTVPDWDAGAKLTVQNWDTGRKMLTMAAPSVFGGSSTVPFRWGSLDATQRNALLTSSQTGVATTTVAIGQARLNWLRGDSTNETITGGLRARPTSKLGAIVNSTPWFTGAPSAGYSNSAYGGGYGTFRTSNTATNAVFVAANDGMLHAINGDTGAELFSYVPRAMFALTAAAPYSKLSAITAKNFALGTGTDSMNVDGSVMAADMKVGGSWSTYLFGSFGRGAKGVYALDVTAPQSVAETTSSVAKWEFSAATNDADMGFIVGRATSGANGQPLQTGYMANGKWAAIYGNGYNSSSGKAALFILFANGPTGGARTTTWVLGTDYIKIPVGAAGLDNGMATPTALDTDNDGAIDTIYAGDLKGNVWKFDVSSSNTALWKVATTGAVPLYQANTTLNGSTTVVAQPITTVVQPFPHPSGGFQLVFGTGQALQSIDYPMSAPFVNSIYGIYDKPGLTTTLTVGLTDLVYKSTNVVTTAAGPDIQIQNNTVDYAANKKGWYINQTLPSQGVVFNLIASDYNRVSLRALSTDGESDGCKVASFGSPYDIDPISGRSTLSNLTGASETSFSSVGVSTRNTFEFGRGGTYRVKPPVKTACVAGAANCTTSDGTGNPCVAGDLTCRICLPGSLDCKCNSNQPQCVAGVDPADTCAYRDNVLDGNGLLTAKITYGKCNDGRLTWREVLRNR